MKKRNRIYAICALLVALFVVVTGCSSSDNKSSGEDGSAQSSEVDEANEIEDSENQGNEDGADQSSEDSEAQNDEGSEAENSNELTLYFVRHGKTWFNTTGQVQGFSDSPLTEVGEEQAQLVGVGMADIKFATAFAGDLGRQVKTARMILAENTNEVPELVELYGLREWNYGGFEGISDEEMWAEELWAPMLEARGLTFDEEWSWFDELGDEGLAECIKEADPYGVAEGYDEIVERAKKAMDEIIDSSLKADGENVLIVSSGGLIPVILDAIVSDQYNGEILSNCSVTTVTYKDGVYTLESVGDTSYIE